MSEKNETMKPRKPRESSPWRVYRIEPGDESEASTTLTLAYEETYDNLAACEKDCRERAAGEIGTRFVAAKCGRIFQAEEVRTVEVRRQ